MTTLVMWALKRLYADIDRSRLSIDKINLFNRDDSARMVVDEDGDGSGDSLGTATLGSSTYGGSTFDGTELIRGPRKQGLRHTDATIIGVGSLDKDGEYAGVGGRQKSVNSGISIRVEGAHTDAHGHVPNAEEFKELVKEVNRVLEKHRNNPPSPYHTLGIPDIDRMHTSHKDVYEANITVRVRGYEATPDPV